MGFFDAMRRSIRIAPIARVLGDMRLPSTAQELIGYGDAHKEAVERLLDFVTSDKQCQGVLQAHGASRDDIRTLYHALSGVTPNWYGSNYVPVSALAFPKALDAALRFGFNPPTDALGEHVKSLFATRTYL